MTFELDAVYVEEASRQSALARRVLAGLPPAVPVHHLAGALAGGYRVAFHLDPLIVYEHAERDYLELIEELFDAIPPSRISFISIGGLRMTPALRAAARRRFPRDPMLAGEEVLSPDGRYRTFAPLRLKLYRRLSERIRRAAPELPHYLCMESARASRRVLGVEPPHPAMLGQRLAALRR